MSVVRRLISENIVNPLYRDQSSRMIVGKVVNAHEDNTCTVYFSDQLGQKSQRRCSVLLADPSGWFPQEDDIVVMEERAGSFYIVAPHTEQYITDHKPRYLLEHDVYDNGNTDTYPGFMID